MKKLKCANCNKVHEYKPEEIPDDVKKGKAKILCDDCGEPDWNGKCEVCGSSPIHKATGLCGPCTFGEADTVGGNW